MRGGVRRDPYSKWQRRVASRHRGACREPGPARGMVEDGVEDLDHWRGAASARAGGSMEKSAPHTQPVTARCQCSVRRR